MITLDLVKKLAKIVYPDYKGRKFYLVKTSQLPLTDMYWSEGARCYYTAVNLATGEIDRAKEVAPWNKYANERVATLSPGYGILTRRFSYGIECGITLYHNEEENGNS